MLGPGAAGEGITHGRRVHTVSSMGRAEPPGERLGDQGRGHDGMTTYDQLWDALSMGASTTAGTLEGHPLNAVVCASGREDYGPG